MVKVIWTTIARSDLKSIYEYISEDSNFYAKRFIEKLIEKVEILQDYPNMGRLVPEFENPKIRELIEGNYRIIYRTSSDHVEIIRIHHSSRYLKKL